MKRISLVFCLLLVLFPATQASADDMAKALDLLCQQSRPWAEIQGQPCDRAALNQLDQLIAGKNIDQKKVYALARQWDRVNEETCRQAIIWCDYQYRCFLRKDNHRDYRLWSRRGDQIGRGDLRYSDSDSSGIDPDLIRRWAYFTRFYRTPDGMPFRFQLLLKTMGY